MSALPPRKSRVQFEHPVRIAALEGPPRIIRTLTSDLSVEGAFVRMPEPLPPGTRVAMSLEAAGQTFPLVEGSVRWCRAPGPRQPGGFGMQFERFLHPRGVELVASLVESLDRGLPLRTARPPRPWLRAGLWAAGVVALAAAGLLTVVAWPGDGDRSGPELETGLAAAAPVKVASPLPVVGPAPSVAPRVDAAPTVPSPVAGPARVDEPSPVAGAPRVDAPLPVDAPPGLDAPPVAPGPPGRIAPPRAPEVAARPAHPAPPSKASRKVDAALAASRVARASGPSGSRAAIPEDGQGEIALSAGAASAVSWTLTRGELRLAPVLRAGQLRRLFLLTDPPRVVFDLDGLPPAFNLAVEGGGPHVARVRVGAQGASTRVVVDLSQRPRRATDVGGAMVLTFEPAAAPPPSP